MADTALCCLAIIFLEIIAQLQSFDFTGGENIIHLKDYISHCPLAARCGHVLSMRCKWKCEGLAGKLTCQELNLGSVHFRSSPAHCCSQECRHIGRSPAVIITPWVDLQKRSLKVGADEAETFWVLEVFLEFPNQFWTGSSGILCEKIHTYRFKPWLLYFFCYMQLNVMWSDIGLNRVNNRPKKKKNERPKKVDLCTAGRGKQYKHDPN